MSEPGASARGAPTSGGDGDPLAAALAADAVDPEPRARDLLQAAAGRAFGYDPSERWERSAPPEPTAPTILRDPIQTRFNAATDLDAWRHIDVTRSEYHVSPDVAAALNENTPQWFLRDLDRPKEMPPVMLEIREGTQLLGLWEEGMREVAEARVLVERPRIVSAAEMINSETARSKAFFAEPWQPSLPDDAPRRDVKIYGIDE